MAAQLNSAAARSRPRRPIAAASARSLSRTLMALASAAGSPGGERIPVSPSATTSGMPPTRQATTAAPHAIASRFTMPRGSYSEGHAKTVAWLRSWITSGLASIPASQMTPERAARRRPVVAFHLWGFCLPGANPRLRGGVQLLRPPQQDRQALLPRHAADEHHRRPARIDAIALQHIGPRVGPG